MTSRETNTADNHANDRLTFLFATFIVRTNSGQLDDQANAELQGLSASITVKNGDQYTGIVSGSVLEANETTVALKMVKRVNIEGGSQNGAESSSKYLGAAPHHSMVFDVKDIADISVDNVVAMESTKAQNGKLEESSVLRPEILTNILAKEHHPGSEPMLISPVIWLFESVTCSDGNLRPIRTLTCRSKAQQIALGISSK